MKPLSTAHGFNKNSQEKDVSIAHGIGFMGRLTLKIFPASKKEQIEIHSNGQTKQRSKTANEPDITVRLRQKAQDNKANLALLKLLKKLTGANVRISAGAKTRLKVIEFGQTNEEFLNSLSSKAKKQC